MQKQINSVLLEKAVILIDAVLIGWPKLRCFPYRLGEGQPSKECQFANGSCAWMKLLVDFFESRMFDMRVNLSRLNACMPEHFLNEPKVGAASQ